MKLLFTFLFLCAQLCYGQLQKEIEIEHYIQRVDSLKAANGLVKVNYPNKTFCGGIEGYYKDGICVLIVATNRAELGFIRRTFYLKDEVFIEFQLHKHSAEWGKYDETYPPDKFEWDPEKMTYTDEEWRIRLSSPYKFTKKTDQGFVPVLTDSSMLIDLLSCGNGSRKFLHEVTDVVDSLKFVTEMPYICEMSPCGDPLYWSIVRQNKAGIELLIDKLDDSTMTTATIAMQGCCFTTADIAYQALSEIIHGIPTFDLLGVPFDTNGCGFCAYWQHLNADYKNRQHFKQAVIQWYHVNKSQLVWIESNDFESCDCAIIHPNGGHYKVKTN